MKHVGVALTWALLAGCPHNTKPPSSSTESGELVPLDDPETANTELIKEGILRHQRSLQKCYERALKADIGVEGRVEVGWIVAAGVVSDVELVSEDIGDPRMVQCMLDAIGAWQFSEVLDTVVSWPFIFRAKD
jgi:hypothetical protein